MSSDIRQESEPSQKQAHDADDVAPVATVASAVLGAFFDEIEKNEDLKDKGSRLRALVLGQGVMAEPAIRAIFFPDTT